MHLLAVALIENEHPDHITKNHVWKGAKRGVGRTGFDGREDGAVTSRIRRRIAILFLRMLMRPWWGGWIGLGLKTFVPSYRDRIRYAKLRIPPCKTPGCEASPSGW